MSSPIEDEWRWHERERDDDRAEPLGGEPDGQMVDGEAEGGTAAGGAREQGFARQAELRDDVLGGGDLARIGRRGG